MSEVLCHVTTAALGEWIEAEPFLHCCTEAQLPFVLERWFAGMTGLVVVRFGVEAVEGRVVWEVSEAGMAPFPHVYGRVAVAGVLAIEGVRMATRSPGPVPQGRSKPLRH